MIAVRVFADKKVALFGLGGSGLATAKALIAGGAQVVAFDDDVSACQRAQAAGITVKDLRELDWREFSALILTPGVPLTHPEPHWAAKLALAANVEIIGDIELFMRERASEMARLGLEEQDCPLITITGTNGKSTTTALITHILRECGREVAMGGNIGEPILQLAPIEKGRVYVIECSSYQIDLSSSLKPTIGILLNLTPDHIDRHGTFEHYAHVKQRLVAAAKHAIIALDDAPCREIAAQLARAGKKPYGFLTQVESAKITEILGNITSLRGQHNAQNTLAALAACDYVGIDKNQARAALASFTGLAHRMEEVGRAGHVLYINDSKATNAEACAPALASFEVIYWIAGGVAKQGGIEALKPFFHKIRHAYLIGAAAADFCQTIGQVAPVTMSGTLAQAVTQAAKDAMADKNSGQVAVLFSPACASFDQFANYVVRGEAFRQLIEELLEQNAIQ